jgi:hypothetical protein
LFALGGSLRQLSLRLERFDQSLAQLALKFIINFLNIYILATIGSFISVVGIFLFLVNILYTLNKK